MTTTRELVAPVARDAVRAATPWQRAYARRLMITDVIIIMWAVLGASLVVTEPDERVIIQSDAAGLTYLQLSVLLIVAWVYSLAALGSRSQRRIGTGSAEYKAVVQSAVVVFVMLTFAAFVLRAEFSRAYVSVALVSGLLMLIVARALWRRWLRLRRQRGEFCARSLLVGSAEAVSKIIEELERHTDAGYFVVGAVVTGGDSRMLPGGVPIVARSSEALVRAVAESGADTVIVTDGHSLPPHRLRELSWSLRPGEQHLVMAPSLTDIAGPRIHSRPVAGLPLIHVETPRYEGADRVVKRAFEVVAAGGLLLVALGPLCAIALLVVTTSPGGLFYRQERIGKGGRPFHMLKFRSMVKDADADLQSLLAQQGTADKPLFKIDNDPRITPIGRFIRRYSIDEVPQLLNVIKGDMSLVGPRPQVAREVALYDDAAARRLFVKPGMTGLWQVSGRSNLTWEESLRLDLYYVENWSLASDLSIMLKTLRAVLARDGAQ